MFADLALHIPNLPKNAWLPLPRRRRQIRDQTVKDPSLSPVQGKARPRHRSDQSRLDPEPRRTPAPRMGPVRFSRDSQNSRVRAYVNEYPQIFCEGAAWNFSATQAKTGS